MNVDYNNLLLLYKLRACNAHIEKAKTQGGFCMLLTVHVPQIPKIMVSNMLMLFMHTYHPRNYSGIIYLPLAVTLALCCSSMVD